MIHRISIILLLTSVILTSTLAQQNSDQSLSREVTLYNPYRPSLGTTTKRSYLPEMNDTAQAKPQFQYGVNAQPLMPQYNISPIKAATLLPDPLPKLYKSYINAGFGTHLSGLGELSIASERSKKGALGLYARHLSTSGKIKLDNDLKVDAGYMDNDISLFGKRFIDRSVLEGSVDFSGKTRHAYGYNTSLWNFYPDMDDTKMKYTDMGAALSYSSVNIDSSKLYYDINLAYDYFTHKKDLSRSRVLTDALLAKQFGTFYAGAGINYELYIPAAAMTAGSEYIFAISPFVKRTTQQWNFKLGLELLRDREAYFHLYPDINFGFVIVPSFINFFTSLGGYLERNDPAAIINVNPYIAGDMYFDADSSAPFLFRLPDTDHQLVATAGLKGNSGIGGQYIISASYSVIDQMLFFSNVSDIFFPSNLILATPRYPEHFGNYFMPVIDAGNLFNLHGEISGTISKRITFGGTADIYSYSIEGKPLNKPAWEATAAIDYNLRDKILAGVSLTATGQRTNAINAGYTNVEWPQTWETEMPAHLNLNLKAEYRYSKILSFWARLNNIALKDYYQWAYYPTHRFTLMAGFTYSL